VVSISQKGGDEVLGYLDRHQIPYTKRPMHSYSPTYYIRIDGALDSMLFHRGVNLVILGWRIHF
jgi:hypothetical protein